MELKYYYIDKAENLSPKIYGQFGIMDEYVFVKDVRPWDLLSEEDLESIVYPLKFNGRAKITDAVYDLDIFRLYVNERTRRIIEEYNLTEHQYVKATFKTKTNDLLPYYYLHIPLPGVEKYIDYKNSTFYKDGPLRILGDIDINSKEEFEAKEKEEQKKSRLIFIKIRDIAFTKDFNPTIDILRLLFIDATYKNLVSERLKNRLEQENVTGIVFKEYPFKISISE